MQLSLSLSQGNPPQKPVALALGKVSILLAHSKPISFSMTLLGCQAA